MIVRVVILLTLCLGTASCGWLRGDTRANAVGARALPFKARLSKGEDKRDFTVAVSNNGAGVDAVRESVRYRASSYCLYGYGGTDIDWQTDPASGDWAFQQDGDKLIFSGRCTARG